MIGLYLNVEAVGLDAQVELFLVRHKGLNHESVDRASAALDGHLRGGGAWCGM